MEKLFNEGGFLSDAGKEAFDMILDKQLRVLFNSATNENELRIISALIQKRVADMATDLVIQKRKEDVPEIKSTSEAQSIILSDVLTQTVNGNSVTFLTTEEINKIRFEMQDKANVFRTGGLVPSCPCCVVYK